MYLRNDLLKLSFTANKTEDFQDCLRRNLANVKKVYSYKLLDKGTEWKVEWLISKVDAYNTITVDEMLKNIDICIPHEKVLVTFKQPPIELMLELYEPLVNNLASSEASKWKLEYEDLCQICRLSIFNLYRKGYFIHKSLIRTVFVRDVLQYLREINREVDYKCYCELNDDENTELDCITDDASEDDLDDAEQFLYDKEAVIKEIGERRYNEYLRQFSNDNVTHATRQQLYKLRKKLNRGE